MKKLIGYLILGSVAFAAFGFMASAFGVIQLLSVIAGSLVVTVLIAVGVFLVVD
jgi:hypothetical protein